jgi:hypothetical protein
MLFEEIDRYFENNDTVLEVLEPCTEIFNRIDEIGGSLRSRLFNNPKDISELLQELNGMIFFLKPIYGVADSAKTENEDRFYNNKKNEIEKEGGKVVSAALDREASLNVANFRRVRNVIESYISLAETCIISSQCLLKGQQQERLASNIA